VVPLLGIVAFLIDVSLPPPQLKTNGLRRGANALPVGRAACGFEAARKNNPW
jgi:hypothetical protein